MTELIGTATRKRSGFPLFAASAVVALAVTLTAAVAAASPGTAQPAPSSAPAPASAPGSASGAPIPAPAHTAPWSAFEVAEAPPPLSPEGRAELTKMPGVNAASPVALGKIPGMRPALASPPGGQPRL